MISRIRIEGHSDERAWLMGQLEWLVQRVEEAFAPITVVRGHELYERSSEPGREDWVGRITLHPDLSAQGDWLPEAGEVPEPIETAAGLRGR